MVNLTINVYIAIMYTKMTHLAVRLAVTTTFTIIYGKTFSVANYFFYIIHDLILPQNVTKFYCSTNVYHKMDTYR